MRAAHFIPLFAAMLMLGSCTINPPLHLKQVVNVVVNVMWKAEVYPEGIKPDGVSIYFFRDNQFYMQHTTAEVDSCYVQLAPGKYRLFMISQSPEEFWTMEFNEMDSFEDAIVRLKESSSSWYTGKEGEIVANNPEMMTVGVSDEFEVTELMLEELKNSTIEAPTMEGGYIRYYTLKVPVTPVSIVSQYWVTIYSANADVLKAVRASTSGMARTFYLTQGKTGDEECTQIITDWALTLDDPVTRVGHLDGKITTFGLPRGEMPSVQRDSTLNVAALLVDNQTVENYRFYVGDKIWLADSIPEGYRALYRLILGTVTDPVMNPADVHPPGDASGFDATVGDWEEGAEVDVPV